MNLIFIVGLIIIIVSLILICMLLIKCFKKQIPLEEENKDEKV